MFVFLQNEKITFDHEAYRRSPPCPAFFGIGGKNRGRRRRERKKVKKWKGWNKRKTVSKPT